MGWKVLKVEKKTWICSCIMINDLGPSHRSVMAAGASLVVSMTAIAEYTGGWGNLVQAIQPTSHSLFLIDTGSIAAAHNYFIVMYYLGRIES